MGHKPGVGQVKEASLTGIALFCDNDRYSDERRLVAEHMNKASMGNLHKVLVVLAPHIHLVLPTIILANDEGPDVLLDQQGNNLVAGRVQSVLNASVALLSQLFQLPTGPRLAQLVLELSPAFIIPLIPGLDLPSTHETWHKAWFVRGDGSKSTQLAASVWVLAYRR